MPQFGETIPLSLKLFDGASNKFVRATLRDATGMQIVGSPALLSHVGEGQYTNSSFAMPNTDYVNVSYQVFDDAGLTTLSTLYSDGQERFELDVPDAELLALLLEIKSLLIGLTAGAKAGSDIKGTIRRVDSILAKIASGEKLTGVINQSTLIGIVEGDDEI